MNRKIKIIVGMVILLLLIGFIGYMILIANLPGPEMELMNAIENKNYKAADIAIQRGADINSSLMGKPLLNFYVGENNIAAVAFLIKHKANVNVRSKYGRTPLHEAALHGCYEITEMLIKAGANVNARNPRGETPLFYAEKGLVAGPKRQPVHYKIAKLLRRYGATY